MTGKPTPILEGVVTAPGVGGAQFSFSDAGNLLYVAGHSGGQNVSIYLSIGWTAQANLRPSARFLLTTTIPNSPSAEVEPAFSPDGRWLAYEGSESGSYEVYVRPFPGPGGKWQISTGGGVLPKWSRNGKELFYRTTDSKIMVVNYTASSDSFHADKPQLWSPGQFTELGLFTYNFDLHPDGKRFAVLKAPGAGQTAAVNKVSFIFNFFDELRSKFPPGK